MDNQEAIWNKLYKERLVWKKETLSLPQVMKGKVVLELGVGTGKTLQSILRQNPKSVTAVDFSQEAINIAQKSIKSDKIKFIKSNILNIPFKEDKFDVIVCYYILNNLIGSEMIKAVEQMKKALVPKGIILFEDFSSGDFREKESKKRKDGLICHFFSESEVKDLFKDFKEVKISKKILHPIRTSPKLERIILSAVIKR